MKYLIILLIILNGVFFEASSQNIPSMRLKDVDFQPSTFTPSTYTPIDNSSSFLKLQETLFKQEQYGYAVGEKYVNFCKLLGDIYMMLYPDKDLLTWYNKYKENAISDIESNYKAGNYQSTSRLIDERIAQITSDPFLLSRIDASQKYKSFKDVLGCNFNGSLIYQWWEDTHPFTYEDKLDANGHLIGYKSTELELPVADFPWFDHLLYVRDNIIRGQKYNSQIGGQIYDIFCANNIDFARAVEQSFQVTVWYYQKELKSHPNSDWVLSQKDLLFENNALISPREYYVRRLTSWVK